MVKTTNREPGISPRKVLRGTAALRRRSGGTCVRPAAVRGGAPANIRVVIRIRPVSERESDHMYRTAVKAVNNQLLVFDPEEEAQPFFYHGVQQRNRDLHKRANKNMQFSFDRVFNEKTNNEEVFKDSTQGLISSLMDGCNCSVFVYGATGAGKTYTMLGKPDMPGITFLTMDELFRKKNDLEAERDFELAVSYLEVYNENVQDLLRPGGPALQVREDAKFGVIVAGIEVRKITEAHELFDLLDRGNKNRTQHPTDANAESSRSHAVFQVYIKMDIKATGQRRMAKLSMIDLAGSERGAATGCKGARFTEGANINKSLLALGNCINSLADGHRHVPYRDSKLTRLLKDSLGGNCHTVMIANVSPSTLCYEDTYNTLKYATRAKKIKANVRKNIANSELHVSQYIKLLEECNAENERLKTQVVSLESELSLLKGKDSVMSIPVIAITTESSSTASIPESARKPNAKDVQKLDGLFEERRSVVKRSYRIRIKKKLSEIRCQYRENAASRKEMFYDSPDQLRATNKIKETCSRIARQGVTLEQEILQVQKSSDYLEKQIDRFVQEHPELCDIHKTHSERLYRLESDLILDEVTQIDKLRVSEVNRLGRQLKNSTKLMKQCFWILKSNGWATNDMVRDYQQLTEPESITWTASSVGTFCDDATDSGVSSTTTSAADDIDDTDNENNSTLTLTLATSPKPTLPCERGDMSAPQTPAGTLFRRVKRKFPPELDGTFTLDDSCISGATLVGRTSSPTTSASMEDVTMILAGARVVSRPHCLATQGTEAAPTKVFVSPAKRLAKTLRSSPRLLQHKLAIADCGPKAKRLVGTMGTAPRFGSATAAAKARRPLSVTQRV